MANRIILKRSSVAAKTPLASDLSAGELAINLADQRLYSKNVGGTVINITVDASHITSGSLNDPSWLNTLAKSKVGLGNVENTALSTWAGSANITTLGTIASGTVPVARVSGLATSATTDTTNAANISSGTLPAGRLPAFTGDATSTVGTSALTLANSGVTAGTYTKVTVDAKGRVTVGASLASADLPTYTGTITSSQVTTALGYTPENPANKGVANGYASLDATGKVPSAQLPASGGTGTVTSVSGTGTVSGLTLSGTVTSSGSLTLGGTLSLTSGNVTTALGYTPYNSTNPSGYITGSGSTTGSAGSVSYGGAQTANTSGSVTAGITVNGVYANGYPTSYGNVISIGGAGLGQLLIGWSGTTGAHADNYVRSLRDSNVGTNNWSAWAKIYTDANISTASITSSQITTGLGYTPYNAGANTVLTSANYTSYSPSLTGGSASGTWGISITGSSASCTGNAATASTTDNINGRAFYNRDSGNGLGQDSYTNNGVGYVTGVSLFGQTDGGLYASAYSSSWIHQIYGDFRTGQIAVRGKNSGTWQSWRTVLDSSNYTSYSPSLTGSGASGSWGISITGSAASITGTYSGTLTSSQVTTALGFTPYNSSNPSGYITSSGTAANVSGTVAVANGGTGATSASAAATNLGLGTGSNVTHATVSDSLGNLRSIPQQSKTAAYTLAASDNGQHISITTGGVTVPASVFSAGQVVTVFNNSGSNQTITQGTSVTLRQAGTANTGNRTLAQYGVATILCVASNTFVISGAGLT